MWRKLRSHVWLTRIGAGIAVIIIFVSGIGVGNGTLRVSKSSRFNDETGLPANIDYAGVTQLYDVLRKNYNGTLTSQQVLDGLKHGLANAPKDPYTEYFSPREAKDFNNQLQGSSLTGIGAQLDQDANGNVIVMSPLPGSPAAAAGLLAKDVIITINNQSTAGMSVNDAVLKIRGPKDSKVTLGIQRGADQLSVTITRAEITIPTATTKVLDDGIGYIQISQFSDNTEQLISQGITDFQHKGVKKLIVDLRDNPGGEVDSAQEIASLWLGKGDEIMEERRSAQVVDQLRATGDNPLKGIPTVVLVNGGSASASEITALALRDHKAATIMGEKSYGKGVVQSVIPFQDGSELKVTIAKWYSPNGTSINHKGIMPDQVVKLSTDDAKAGNDTQLQAAKSYLESK